MGFTRSICDRRAPRRSDATDRSLLKVVVIFLLGFLLNVGLVGMLAESFRIETRRWGAEFLMIPYDRIHVAALNANGDDEELLMWFEAA